VVDFAVAAADHDSLAKTKSGGVPVQRSAYRLGDRIFRACRDASGSLTAQARLARRFFSDGEEVKPLPILV